MKVYKQIISVLIILCVTIGIGISNAIADAESLNVNIILKEIIAERVSETSRDEIYFSITKYFSLGTSEQERMPIHPTHWLTDNLSDLKNINLSKISLKSGEKVKVVLSLIEHDLPPWDGDDHLGSVQLEIANYQGGIITNWSKTNFEQEQEIEVTELKQSDNSQLSFIFKGPKSQYKVKFMFL